MSLFDTVCRDELHINKTIPNTYDSITTQQFDSLLSSIRAKSRFKHKLIWFIIIIFLLLSIFIVIIIIISQIFVHTKDHNNHNNLIIDIDDIPQQRVECYGRHALCTFATCNINGQCNCWIFNSIYTINTYEIFNDTMREITQSKCTMNAECKVNEAPICKAINSQNYYVNNFKSQVTSGFSWENYCDRANPVNCKYGLWAACMTAPCIVDKDKSDSAICFCKVMNSSWTDFQWPYTESNCNGYPSNIISSTVPSGFNMSQMPGAQYVDESCKKIPPPSSEVF